MGVTIHFEGQLIDESAYRSLIDVASRFAFEQGWLTEPIEMSHTTLSRVRDEKEWDYSGPVKGMVVYPHEDCEPLRLEFDSNLFIQEFVKTQFAGVQIHLKVVELLRAIRPFFSEFKVEDEGEFWQSGDVKRLEEHMRSIQNVIDAEIKKNPSSRMKIKSPNGRIFDLLT
jgi:hypothetical protein